MNLEFQKFRRGDRVTRAGIPATVLTVFMDIKHKHIVYVVQYDADGGLDFSSADELEALEKVS